MARSKLAVVDATGARVVPPTYLTEQALKIWNEIIASQPADFFRPGDAPLLGAYCTAIWMFEQASVQITLEGIVIDDGKRRTSHPAKDTLTSCAAIMSQMSVKLRLAQSSRYTEKTAATKTKSANGDRPWADDEATG